ncbi:MAG: polysaccharide pyruvyl transferase family protein, partial [Patescibacteria group bacterium]
RKPVLFAFQGVGPLRTAKGKRWARRALRHARFLSVRDTHSFDRAKALVPRVPLVQAFDPVLLLIHAEKTEAPAGRVFTLIPRHNSPAAFVEHAKLLLSRGKYEGVTVLSLHPDHPGEKGVCRKVQEAIPVAELWEVRTLEGLLRHLRRSSYVLSARYHGALAALALGIPFETFVQEKRDKLSSLTTTELRGALLALAERGERELKQELESLGMPKRANEEAPASATMAAHAKDRPFQGSPTGTLSLPHASAHDGGVCGAGGDRGGGDGAAGGH